MNPEQNTGLVGPVLPKRPESTAEPEAEQARAPRRSPLPLLLSLLAVLLAAAAAGGTAWLYLEERALARQQSDTATAIGRTESRLSELSEDLQAKVGSSELAELRATQAGAAREIGELGERLAAIDDDIQTAQRRVEAIGATQEATTTSMGVLRELIGRDRDDWTLAEIDYLIRIAMHRARLERDFVGAIKALEAADQRLREIGDPTLLDVRAALASDIAALRAVDEPDLAGIALRIYAVAEQVRDLGPPVSRPGPAPAAPADAAATEAATRVSTVDADPPTNPLAVAWSRVLSWLAGQVSVSRIADPAQAAPRPGMSRARQETLEALSFARAALLDRNQPAFQRELERAHGLLLESFDPDAPSVAPLIAELQALGGSSLTPRIPDLGGSLAALEARAELGSERPSGPGDGPAPEAAGVSEDPFPAPGDEPAAMTTQATDGDEEAASPAPEPVPEPAADNGAAAEGSEEPATR